MSPDVTINISMGTGEVTSSEGTAGAQRAVTAQTGAQGPTPMPLDQLQVSAAQEPPAPKSPEELLMLTAGEQAASGQGAPPPMAIEQLLGSSVFAAPTPMDFAALQAQTGPPGPQAFDVEQPGDAQAPEPMALEDLGAPGQGTEGGAGAKGERRREK